MSWIDISVGSGSSGSGSSNNLLGGFLQSLGNALNNAHSGGLSGFPTQAGDENNQIVGYYDDPQGYNAVIKKFLGEKNYHSNERLKNAFERIINHQNRINQLNQEITDRQNAINSLNNEIHHLNQEIDTQNQAINHLNQEIASLNNEISAQKNAIKQEEETLNALELQTSAKKQLEKQIKESLKQLEKLKQELKRLKKQSKWEKSFSFLTDNTPPNIQAKQQQALQAKEKNALINFFLTDPYAILPKGFIYEYHNPGKETYNALNAPNNMDGINNNFRVNALNQVLDNSYQKFLPGNDSYNALGAIEQVKALKFYDVVLNYNSESENTQNALFFKQISQYAKGLRLKILTAKSAKKELERLEKLENTIKEQQEQLKGKDLNALTQEIQKEQENALKLKESIKAKQNHTEALKNAINQKESAKNPIEQQKQTLENQRNEKEQQKQNQQNAKQELERERQNHNNEINAIGNERISLKQLGNKDNFLGITPYLNNNGAGRTYAKAAFSDKNKSIREYYEIETKIKNILGFYRIGESEDRILQRLLELNQAQKDELTSLLLS
ncbi:UV radiation resistance protein [Helicobacter pylori]|nr:UV radiation resistance protein [Helicobacter pylori]